MDFFVYGEFDEEKYIYYNGSYSEMKDIYIERVDFGEEDFILYENLLLFLGIVCFIIFIIVFLGFQFLLVLMRDWVYIILGWCYYCQFRNILFSFIVFKFIENVYCSMCLYRKVYWYFRQVVILDVFLLQDGEWCLCLYSVYDLNRGCLLISGEDMELCKFFYKFYNEV